MKLLILLPFLYPYTPILKAIEINSILREPLTQIVHTNAFSIITIDISQACHSEEILAKCRNQNCRGNTILDKMKYEPVIFNNYDSHSKICYKEDKIDGKTINLRYLVQDNTGYKYGAHNIWQNIHKNAKNIHELVSGLHFSITLHISHFNKRVGGSYQSDFTKYEELYTDDRRDNLFLLFAVLLDAVSRLDENIFSCVKFESGSEDSENAKQFIVSVREINLKDSRFRYDSQYFDYVDLFLDCIECGTCRMWGKIQFKGLETALKVINGIKVSSRDAFYLFHLLKKVCDSIEFYNRYQNSAE